jgi:hypothetical protein
MAAGTFRCLFASRAAIPGAFLGDGGLVTANGRLSRRVVLDEKAEQDDQDGLQEEQAREMHQSPAP